MTADEWRRVKAIVFDAWNRTPPERPAFVEGACAGDPELLREVSSLLESMELAGNRFDRPAFGVGVAGPAFRSLVAGDTEADVEVGHRIGAYAIQRELGRGGMGTVYLAARADSEFTQQVALKIIKRGMDTDAIVRRFRTERQILADLDHPCIARLLDGGTTPDGRPYLVMEYVDGPPLPEYCDQQQVSIADRLALFRKICAAVAHAHQHLIVHRDIKPSNVLVATDGTPKLLDFGVAKILDADTNDNETVHGWLTPTFASPEQLRGERVTTVSDVYSLGLLLYDLLCGAGPFRNTPSGPHELLRAVLEQDPEKPSMAVTREGSGAICARRQSRPDRLSRTLRGDLDNIVLKALDKDPARRYQTALDLSDDIRRYLTQLPVAARPDTLRYRTAKFVHRHTGAVIAAGTIALTLIVATGVTLAHARIARREREHADRRFRDVRQLANSFLFDFHDAIATLPGATPAREMVVQKAQQYLSSLALEAGDDRELSSELSTAYFKLGNVQGRPSASRTGDTEGALVSYGRALDLRRRLSASEPDNLAARHDVAIVLVRMGPILQVHGDPTRAIELMGEAMQITDGLMARTPSAEVRRTAFRAPLYLGDALFDTGDYHGALTMFQKAFEIANTARQDLPEADVRHRFAVARERLGIMWMVTGEPAQALESFRRALEDEEAMVAAEAGNADYVGLTANGHYYVGEALRGLRQYPEALTEEYQALALYERLLRDDPKNAGPKKDIGGCAHKIAEIMVASGDHRGARRLLERAVMLRRELTALDRGSIEYVDDLADSLTLWGESLLATGEWPAAIGVLNEARTLLEPIASSRPQQAVYRRDLARLYCELGDAYAAQSAAFPKPRAAQSWRDARDRYRQGLDLWLDLNRRHALWAEEATRPDEAAQRLAKCERALG